MCIFHRNGIHEDKGPIPPNTKGPITDIDRDSQHQGDEGEEEEEEEEERRKDTK